MLTKPQYITISASGLVFLLGFSVLFGWYTHNTSLIQLHPTLVAMQYNTALGFLFGGISLFFAIFQQYLLSKIFGIATALIGFLTLVQYIFQVDLLIDELLMESYVLTQASHPGRMAPNTAICFLLSGICISLFTEWKRPYVESIVEITGMLIVALALIALLGYIQGIERSYGWGRYTRMALHTAVGFIILGLGISIYIWDKKQKREFTFPLAVIFLLCVGIMHFDFVSPLGVATGAIYCLLLFCSLWFSNPNTVFVFACIASLLTLTGLFISPESNTGMEIAVLNRIISLVVIWILTLLLYQLRKTQFESQKNAMRLDTVINNSVAGIITIDENGLIESFNQACTNMFGYTDEEVIGKSANILIPELFHGEPDQNLLHYHQTGNTNISGIGRKVNAQKKDGKVFPIDLSVTEIQIGDRKILSGFIRDISELEELNKKLEHEKNLLTILMDNIPDSIYFKDTNRRFTRVNKGQANLLGITNPDEAIGKSDADFFVDEMARSTEEEEKNIIQTKTPLIDFQREVIEKSGIRRWHLDTKFPIINSKGVCTGIVGTARNITEIKKTEQELIQHQEDLEKLNAMLQYEENLLQILMDSIPVNIYFKDLESRFIRINKNLAGLFGLERPHEAIGKSDADFLSPEYAASTFAEEKKIMETHIPMIDVIKEIIHEGKHLYYLDTKLPMFAMNGQCNGIVGVAKEITELKETEQELIKQKEELAKSNQQLNEFSYVASHDLQEPLRTVGNYMALLKRKFGDTLEPDAFRYVENAVDATKRMSTLIQDLLAFSRVTTHATEFIDVDLHVELKTVLENLEHSIQEKNAVIEYDELPVIKADQQQIIQLFQNLIGNALKYIKDKSPHVKISCEDKEQEWMFSVQDNGIGIDSKFHARVFKAFQRLHTREEFSGSGIGLAICQRVVERHGGEMCLESEEGKGSTFYFTIAKNLRNE